MAFEDGSATQPTGPAPAPAAVPMDAAAGVPGGTGDPTTAVSTGVQPTTPAGPSNNRMLHSFVNMATRALSDVSGALAGKSVPTYSYDAQGRLITTQAPPMSPTQKIKAITNNALAGLSAGAQVGPQKSAAASWAAGIGAGADAIQQRDQKQDLLKRGQAKDEFETEQRAVLQKHQVAATNALTYRNMVEAQKLGLDMDTQRQANMELYRAAKDAGLDAQVVSATEAEQMAAAEKGNNDPSAAKHIFLPGGFSTPTVDEQSQTTKPGEGQVIVLPIHGADGKVPLPSSLVSDIQKYAPLGGKTTKNDVDRLTAGLEVDPQQLSALMLQKAAGYKEWLKGELTPELTWTGEKQDQPLMLNSVTKEPIQQKYPSGAVPETALKAQGERADKEAQEEQRRAQAQDDLVKHQTDLINAEVARQQLSSLQNNPNLTPQDKAAAVDGLMKAYGNLPPTARGILMNLSPQDQNTVLGLYTGRQDPKSVATQLRKGVPGLSRTQYESLVRAIDPNWKESKYEEVKKVEENYQNPINKLGAGLMANGQLLRHAADAKELSDRLTRTNSPILNMPINQARLKIGAEDAPLLEQVIIGLTAAREEWQNVVKSGHAGTADENHAKDALVNPDITVGMAAAALYQMGHQGLDRLSELDQPYVSLTGTHYGGILSTGARDAAVRLGLGSRLNEFGPGNQMQTGPAPTQGTAAPIGNPQQNPPSAPAPQSHVFDPQAWQKANPRGDVNAAIAAAKQQGYEVKQ